MPSGLLLGPEVLSGLAKETIYIKMLNGQIITIPVSGELKIGLLKAAIKKAGLTEEEFMELLS